MTDIERLAKAHRRLQAARDAWLSAAAIMGKLMPKERAEKEIVYRAYVSAQRDLKLAQEATGLV
jgi:hypothetical protein